MAAIGGPQSDGSVYQNRPRSGPIRTPKTRIVPSRLIVMPPATRSNIAIVARETADEM